MSINPHKTRYSRNHRLSFWKAADLFVVTIPVGLGFGRLGNFINGELFGRVTEVPWAMVFPYAGRLPRHPSQLYEALLEGVVLFIILWAVKDKPWRDVSTRRWPHGSMLTLFRRRPRPLAIGALLLAAAWGWAG